MSSAASFWQSRVHRALVPLLMAGSLVPVWSSAYFPSQNGPWHLLTIQMLHEYSNPAFNYAEFYEPSFHAIPHLAHTLLVYALAFVFPLLVAHQIAISLYVLLLPASVFWLLATVNPDRMAAGYVSFLLVYNVPLLRGYHDYVLGIPLVFLALTCWLRHRHQLTPARLVGLMLLVVCVYFSHVFNFLMLGLAMLVYSLHEDRSARALGRLALIFLPATLLLAEYAVFSARQTQWMDYSDVEFLAPHRAGTAFFDRFFHTLSPAAYLLALVPLALGAVFVLRSLIWALRESGWRVGRVAAASPMTVLFVLCLVLYFLAPYKLFGWHYVNVRFVPYVVVFAVAGLAITGHRARTVLVACIAVASFATFGLLSVEVRKAGHGIEEYLSAVDKVRPNSVMLPLGLERFEVGQISPLAHAHDYYQLFRGGANGKGIATFNTVTPMVYRTYPVSERFPGWSPNRSSDVRHVSDAYDYVLAWGRDAWAGVLLRGAGFELTFDEGNLQLFENQRRASDARTHE